MSEQPWVDKLAVQELIYAHCDAVTRGDLGALEPLYAPDAVWEIPVFGLRTESAQAFFDFLADATATADLLLQTAHNPVIRLIDENTAHATTTIFELAKGPSQHDSAVGAAGETVSMVQLGIYYDEVSKDSGRWLFTHRRFVQCYIEHDGSQGDLPVPRSSLLKGDVPSA